MPYTIDNLPDEPIMILVHEGSQSLQEIDQARDDMVLALDAQPEPVFLVLDIRRLAIGLDDMPGAAAKATSGSSAPLHHSNIRESLIVSSSGLVKLGALGLRTATFGSVNVRVFETTEQAIDYCREKIAIQASQSTHLES
jgi:hypothetical protein